MITSLVRRYLASAPEHVREAARVTSPPALPTPAGMVLWSGKLYCREHPNVFLGHPSRPHDPDKHHPCPFC